MNRERMNGEEYSSDGYDDEEDDDISLTSAGSQNAAPQAVQTSDTTTTTTHDHAQQPQPYTSDIATRRDQLRRRRTREEEIASDEEYLEPRFNEDDIHDDLNMQQNIDLYLVNSSADIMGERHASVGMERPYDADDVMTEHDSNNDLVRPLSRRRRSSTAAGAALRRTSTFQSMKRFNLFDDDFKNERLKMYTGFLINYLVLGLGFMIVLSIYWGSFYNRNLRYKDLDMLVVIGEQQVGDIPPLIGESVEYTAGLSTVKSYGNWKVYNYTEFDSIASANGRTMLEEVESQIHYHKYWSAIYVTENATLNLYEKITSNSSDVDTTTLIKAVYGSGRDPNAYMSYIKTFIGVFEQAFQTVASELVYPNLLSSFNETQLENLNLSGITDAIMFQYIDQAPITNLVVVAPLQLGVVYLVVFAFFQFLFTIQVHQYVATRVKGVKYILFRIAVSQTAYIVLGLAYTVLNVSFQLDYTKAFGKSGFLVMWAFAYLTIASLGSLNENVALILIVYFPPAIGIWLILLMCANVTVAFSPLALCPTFYRYGYAMPLYNSVQLFKVIFFDEHKRSMGREIGILLIWIVLTNALLPFTLKHVAATMKQRQAEAAKVSADAEEEKRKEEEADLHRVKR